MCSQSIDLTQSQKLPDTCPTAASQCSPTMPNSQVSPVWGYLFPRKPFFQWTALTGNDCLVGRSPSCHIVLGSSIDKNLRCQMSKEHFRVRRESLQTNSQVNVVYIDDLSFNGTYVNGRRIGKGRSAVLKNNDCISLALSANEAFVYTDCKLDPEHRHFPEELTIKYAISRKIGAGAYGEVRLIYDKTSGEGFAMKIIKKAKFLSSARPGWPSSDEPVRIRREIEILKRLQHSFVIRFHNAVYDEETVFLIVELVHGGELFNRIKKNALKESEAKYFFYQLVLAIRYLHRQGIIHRDIKLENILLTADVENPVIKLADFGLSKFIDSESVLKTYCGTPLYIAPEVLRSQGRNGTYDTQADVWSMGVVLYMCLSGISPFVPDEPNNPLSTQILTGHYYFPKKHWSLVSSMAVNLVKSMLVVDPRRRITIEKILDHPWLRDNQMKARVGRLMRFDGDCRLNGKENAILEESDEDTGEYFPVAKRARVSDEDVCNL